MKYEFGETYGTFQSVPEGVEVIEVVRPLGRNHAKTFMHWIAVRPVSPAEQTRYFKWKGPRGPTAFLSFGPGGDWFHNCDGSKGHTKWTVEDMENRVESGHIEELTEDEAKSLLNPPPDPSKRIAFKECDTCRAKPGTPILCEGCLHNREALYRAQERMAELLSLHTELAAKNTALADQDGLVAKLKEENKRLGTIVQWSRRTATQLVEDLQRHEQVYDAAQRLRSGTDE